MCDKEMNTGSEKGSSVKDRIEAVKYQMVYTKGRGGASTMGNGHPAGRVCEIVTKLEYRIVVVQRS